jgi:hypothetical protein
MVSFVCFTRLKNELRAGQRRPRPPPERPPPEKLEREVLELLDWYWLAREACWLPQERACACDSRLDLFWLQLLEVVEALGEAARCCEEEPLEAWRLVLALL